MVSIKNVRKARDEDHKRKRRKGSHGGEMNGENDDEDNEEDGPLYKGSTLTSSNTTSSVNDYRLLVDHIKQDYSKERAEFEAQLSSNERELHESYHQQTTLNDLLQNIHTGIYHLAEKLSIPAT
uniref:Tumor necrosis factor receptor superfamily member 6 n=1 Tax=Lygus hesperus TaxID=30085 RepID=A0A0A9W793_LYGHE